MCEGETKEQAVYTTGSRHSFIHSFRTLFLLTMLSARYLLTVLVGLGSALAQKIATVIVGDDRSCSSDTVEVYLDEGSCFRTVAIASLSWIEMGKFPMSLSGRFHTQADVAVSLGPLATSGRPPTWTASRTGSSSYR